MCHLTICTLTQKKHTYHTIPFHAIPFHTIPYHVWGNHQWIVPFTALGSAAGGGSPLIRLRRLYTSGLPYERPRATRALWWGAPQTADPPTPGPEKHQKSFRRVGERFLDGIRVAHKRLQEHSPPPILRVPKIGKKCRFDAFFGRFFAFRKAQNVVNYSIFAFYRLLREPFRRVGESFLAGIRVAHQRLQEQKALPPPVLKVPKIGKKRRFDTFFGRFFAFRKSQNAVNYSIFAF